MVSGKKIDVYRSSATETITDGKAGKTLDFASKWDSDFLVEKGLSYLDYANNLFSRSNIKKKFTWKGNPCMMPFDTIYFGSDDTPYTVESMTLEHSGGGLISQIEAREGII